MHRLTLDGEAGRLSEELARRGISGETRVRAVVEVVEQDGLPMSQLVQEGDAFAFLSAAPELYTGQRSGRTEPTMFEFGAIVLARFRFTDLSGDKRRPAPRRVA
jgi:hypothetical protein